MSPLFRLPARLRTLPPYAADTALAALVLLAASVQFLLPEKGGDTLTWQGYLLVVATAAPLVWRRRAPFASACGAAFATCALALYHKPPPDVAYAGLVSLYTLAVLGRPWQRRLMLAGSLVSSSLLMAFREHAEPFEYAFHLLSFVSAYGLGVLTRTRQAYTAAVEDRARRLEAERAREIARAAAEERTRIARDMHDILAHAVSVMVVQAEAGPVAVRGNPARAEASFDAIAAAGREAMGQLRRILGLLKEDDGDGWDGPRTPQPTVAGVADLVRQVSGTGGLDVALRTTGEPRPLPPDTEVAAYRVVQEALTNVLKHARSAARAEVRLDWAEGELSVTVTDDGSPASGALPGAGRGLVGIRERAAACGGSAETGPHPDGPGFRVTVRLPLAPFAVRRAAV